MIVRTTLLIFLTFTLSLGSCEEDAFDFFSDDPRAGLTGTWKADEDSELFGKKSTDGFYQVQISKDQGDSTAILISNFYELSGQLKANLNGRNLTIPQQVLQGHTIKGYGLVAFDMKKIDWSYTVNLSTGEKDGVTATYTR